MAEHGVTWYTKQVEYEFEAVHCKTGNKYSEGSMTAC
jgi:hypothetical protein